MIDFKTEQSDNTTTLTISGELSIQNASALQGILIRALETSAHLTVNLENVSSVDLSFLQLLCSVHKTSADLKKGLTLTGSLQDVFRNAVKDAGFYRHTGCGVDENKCCLWIDPDREKN